MLCLFVNVITYVLDFTLILFFTLRYRSRAGAKLNERFTTLQSAGGVRLSITAARSGDSGVYTLQVSSF